MKLFDLHCDTPLELFRGTKKLQSNDLHVSIEKASVFDRYVQCSAVWSDKRLTDSQCFQEFSAASTYFCSEACDMIVSSRESLENAKKAAFIPAVEDARLLCENINNLDILYGCGIRILTLLWAGISSLGAAWNAEGSLTDFGKEVLERCFDIGIIPDLSHANDTVCSYAAERSIVRKKPVIATHSNSRAVHRHMRNLPDCIAREIALSGGIIGVSLYPPHLRGETADIFDITDHIEHYVSTVGSDSVCLGCDFDGIDKTPLGISDISDMPKLHDALSKRLGSHLCEKVFFNNAYNFFVNNLPKER